MIDVQLACARGCTTDRRGMYGCIHRFCWGIDYSRSTSAVGSGPTIPLSSDDMVRPPKVRPDLYDLLQQIESSDDDVSRRVAQAACDSDTSGSDHAVDDEDDSDSEVSMRCEFVDSMAAESTESRSVQSDEGAASADSDPCETD